MKTERPTVRRVLGMVIGIVIISLGIAIFKQSHLGNDSITALNIRLSELLGISLGVQNICTNLVFLVVEFIWGRKYIGLGTLVNGLGCGFIITFFYDIIAGWFGPAEQLPIQLLWVVIAVPVTAFGCSLYQTADLGVAPYDSLALALQDHLHKPYFGCRVFTDALCAAITFLLGGLVVLIARIQYLPATIAMIFQYAFQPQAIIGGGIGYALKTAISQGAKRGLFSNEAGMGSTPHAHAQANVAHAHDQGVVAMIGVFIDTFIILTMTALVILSTGSLESGLTGSALAQTAFNSTFGSFGNVFIAICMFFFAFTTIIGWYFFGEVNVKALFGKGAVKIYSVLAIIFIMIGSTLKVDLVWNMSDMFNGLMVLPNLLGLLPSIGVVIALSKESGKL